MGSSENGEGRKFNVMFTFIKILTALFVFRTYPKISGINLISYNTFQYVRKTTQPT